MPILNIQIGQAGMTGVKPKFCYIDTNDTLAEITTAGYLNLAVQQGNAFSESDMCLVTTKTTPNATSTQVALLEVTYVAPNWSLAPAGSPGQVVLPTIANHIATYTNTTGTLSEDAATAINGGNIQAGLSGTAGYLASFPATAARGSMRFVAANSAGDTVTTVTNASQAAARTFTIPDGGQSASNFLITDSAGTQTIATGSLALTLGNVTATAGNITAGSTSGAGVLTSFSGTGSAEFLRLAAINNAGGNFSTTISNASSVGQSQTLSIPDSGSSAANFIISSVDETLPGDGSQTISVGQLIVSSNGITSGNPSGSTSGGSFAAYPSTAASGAFFIIPIANAGNFTTQVSSVSTLGQNTIYTIPDPGAATANFLLDNGASNLLAQQEFVSINEVLSFGTGTWTTTRIAQGNYVKRHTPGDETSIIGIDITPMIRTAASKGFRLDTFDVIYAIAANALDAHTVTLDRIAYANNVAVSVTSVPITATLATATQANPYVTTATVDTPAFDNTTNSKYIIEVTVNNAAASEYDFYGVMLKFSQTVA